MGAVSSNVSGRNAGMGGATYRTLHQQHTVHADRFQKLQIQVDVQVPQLGHWYQCLKLAQCTVVAQLHNCTHGLLQRAMTSGSPAVQAADSWPSSGIGFPIINVVIIVIIVIIIVIIVINIVM